MNANDYLDNGLYDLLSDHIIQEWFIVLQRRLDYLHAKGGNNPWVVAEISALRGVMTLAKTRAGQVGSAGRDAK